MSLDEDDDALPAVGKVWDDSGPSLSEMLKARQAGAEPQPVALTDKSNIEPVSSGDLPSMWQRLLEVLEARGPALHSLVVHGKLTSIDGDRAVISYDRKHQTFVKLLDRNGKKDAVRDALSQVAGRPLGVKFDVESGDGEAPATATGVMELPPARPPVKRELVRAPVEPPLQAAPPAPPAIRVTAELKASLRNSEPLIKTLMDDFGAEIVKVEPPES